MKRLMQWLRPRIPADADSGIRIISGPTHLVIDGQTYRWTPAMEAATEQYRAATKAAKDTRDKAESEYRAAMVKAARDLISKGQGE